MFGFPQKDHTTYKRNFLKTVVLRIAFEDNARVIERKKEVFNIFRETFPRTNENVTSGVQVSFNSKEKTPILEPIKNSNALDLKSGDGQKIISINSSSLTATYNGTVYKNFQQLQEELSVVIDFFNLLEIQSVKRISIRKINLIDFRIVGDASDTLKYVINSELLSNLNYFPSSDLIKQNIQNVRYESERDSLNIRYGLNVPPTNNSELGQVVLDIDLISLSDVDISEIFAKAYSINSEIFNIFEWAMSRNAIDLLNE